VFELMAYILTDRP